MTLRVQRAAGRHPPGTHEYFSAPDPQPFFREDVWTCLHGPSWESVLVDDGERAFHHACVPSRIGATDRYDVEPFFGYAGPRVSPGAPPGFVSAALETYSASCRERGIVAELIRFDPALGNHRPLRGRIAGLEIVESKPIAYVAVADTAEAQYASYPAKCRNMVRAGERRLRAEVVPKDSPVWEGFASLYRRGLAPLGAGGHWDFDDRTFARWRASDAFALVATFAGADLCSAALLLVGAGSAFYFLATSDHERLAGEGRGANHLAVHAATRLLAGRGVGSLCLGGGNDESLDDPLMRFKRSFGGELRSLPLGFFRHDREALDELYRRADAEAAGASKLFLRYRLAPGYSAGRMQPVAPGSDA